ncbi:hypothetical protein LCGC14_2640020, partial [marine sediment metagenome]
NQHPQAKEYFVFPEDHPQYDDLVKKYGKTPKELDIILPMEEEDKIASQWYRCYSRTRGLICRGDGETCTRMVDKATGGLANRESGEVEWRDMTCAGRECADYEGKQCREIMNLLFLLPGIPSLGVWQIDTSSINSIRNVNDNLALLRSVLGRISMLPLLLTLEPKEVTPPDGKKKTVRVLNLRSKFELIEAARMAQKSTLELLTGDKFAVPEDADKDRPALLTSEAWEEDELARNGTQKDTQPASAPEKAEVVTSPDYKTLKDVKIYPAFPRDAAVGTWARIETSAGIFEKGEQGEWKGVKGSIKQEGNAAPVTVFPGSEDALTETFGSLGKAEPPLEVGGIDMAWLKESMVTLKWQDATVISFLKNRYKVDDKGTLEEVIDRLSKKDKDEFTKQVQDFVDRQSK